LLQPFFFFSLHRTSLTASTNLYTCKLITVEGIEDVAGDIDCAAVEDSIVVIKTA